MDKKSNTILSQTAGYNWGFCCVALLYWRRAISHWLL